MQITRKKEETHQSLPDKTPPLVNRPILSHRPIVTKRLKLLLLKLDPAAWFERLIGLRHYFGEVLGDGSDVTRVDVGECVGGEEPGGFEVVDLELDVGWDPGWLDGGYWWDMLGEGKEGV